MSMNSLTITLRFNNECGLIREFFGAHQFKNGQSKSITYLNFICIKNLYQELHPDVNPSPRAAKDFLDLRDAYTALQPENRQKFEFTENM